MGEPETMTSREPSLLIHNGVIHTLAPEQPTAESMLLEAGRITWIGKSCDAPPAQRVMDVRGRAVLPAFIDAHSHLYWMAEDRLQCNLAAADVRNIPDLLQLLRSQVANKARDGWIVAVGVNEFRLLERRLPTRYELDRISDGRPVALRRVCGHAAVANSAALERIGVRDDTPDPPGGIIERESGRPTGVLRESAAHALLQQLPIPSSDALVASLHAVAKAYLACGVVGATEAAVGFTSSFDNEWSVWETVRSRGDFPLRMAFMLRIAQADLQVRRLQPSGSDLDWQVDAIKFFADGTVGSRSAAVSAPYEGSICGCGLFMQGQGQLETDIAAAAAAGWHIAVHAIGDRAIDLSAEIFRSLRKTTRAEHTRLRVEHLALPSLDALRRLRDARAIVVPQYAFLHELGDGFIAALGSARAARLYPGRSLLDHELVVAGSSDAPAASLSPFTGIAAAMSRTTRAGVVLDAHEAVRAHEAIAMYTSGAAAAVGHDAVRGVLRPGAVADAIVLDRDPFHCTASEILASRVEATIARGRIAHEDWVSR